ncbi:MAG: sensor histidine kinase [Spirochaetota bacterium]
MEWLIPAVIATLASSALLALVYLYLAAKEHERSLATLFWSWTIYSLRFVFMLLYVAHGSHLFFAANQVCVLVSSHLLLSGFRLWLGRSASPVGWTVATGVALAWLVAGEALGVGFTAFTIPVFFYSGWLFVWAGVLVLRSSRGHGVGVPIVGITLLVWGVHKMDYPFLRTVEWFAPWGYLLGAVAAAITGIGMVLIYFEQARGDLVVAVRERETLFREVHHRVKNNLAIVSSLLEFQKGPDPASRRSLTTIQNRVGSMALLHEQLYRTGGLATVDSADYLKELIDRIRATVDPATTQVELTSQIDAAELPIDVAIPLGLVTNELVSNALKHAFPGRERGTINVRFIRGSAGGATVAIDGERETGTRVSVVLSAQAGRQAPVTGAAPAGAQNAADRGASQ